jgi:exosortase A
MATDGLAGRITVRGSLCAGALVFVALLLVYYQTAAGMVSIWSRSDTFAHGFLILPISLWLAWTRRDLLASVVARPAGWVALFLLPLGFVWLLAWLVDVAVIKQLALVAMLITGVWAVLGHKLGLVLVFPLFFLFFAVPIGEGLVAPMMEFTATSTVWMIEMTGIPVYREGLYFNLPTGHWSVVEACSGVRYIIASVTVGVLYAYLTYRSWTRRLLFVLVSAIVPIFANSVRAYIIVMLGHMSDMTVATGADHLVYGWVFFGFVIFVLFWLGSFFREDHLDEAPAQSKAVAQEGSTVGTNGMLVATCVATVALASVAPWLAHGVFGVDASALSSPVTLPLPQDGWQSDSAADSGWRPPSRVAGETVAYFARGGNTVGIIVQFADGTIEGADVIGSSQLFEQEDSGWVVTGKDTISVTGPDGDLLVDQAQVRGSGETLLAWSWYVLSDSSTSNDYQAKLQQTLARLGFSDSRVYRIVVATPANAASGNPPEILKDFVSTYVPLVYQSLRRAGPAAD